MHICNALKEHGYSTFSLSIIEYINITDLSLDKARKLILEREQYYLDLIFSEDKPNTYNILKQAGSLLGFIHSSETKALMSEALSGEKNPRGFLGKTHSAETLAKMSASLTGKIAPPAGGHPAGEFLKFWAPGPRQGCRGGTRGFKTASVPFGTRGVPQALPRVGAIFAPFSKLAEGKKEGKFIKKRPWELLNLQKLN
jgi:hypothetical protein